MEGPFAGFGPLLSRFVVFAPQHPKVVVSRSWGRALLRCSVHIVPIGVTISLAYLNLNGYFIGGLLAGSRDDTSQSVYRLCLQVVAKLVVLKLTLLLLLTEYLTSIKEVFTVASLANTILTIVRRELVFDTGIPLGLLYSPTRFTQLTYLFSSAFWSCARFPASWIKRSFLIASVMITAIIALFAGPATASLLLPEVRPNWPAGGTSFWLIGQASDLWPVNIGHGHIGGKDCEAPTENLIRLAPANATRCIWHSSAAFSDAYRRSKVDPDANLVVNDGLARRIIHISKESDIATKAIDTWALSTYAAIARHSYLFVGPWWQAAYRTTRTKYWRIKYGTRGLESSKVNTPVPAVRARCNIFTKFNFRGIVSSNTTVSFPFLPEYDSAYLLIHFPFPSRQGAALSCAIDAKWGPGAIIFDKATQGDTVGYSEFTNLRPRNVSELGSERGFLPINDGSWTTVSISPEWLGSLTPSASNVSEGYTTISSTLENMALDNSTGYLTSYSKWDTARIAVETLLAATVADGMSRIGLAKGFVDLAPAKDQADQFLDNGTAYVPPSINASGHLTELHWDATVSGYAYKADTTAHFLALAVLFAHLLVALVHIVYVLITRTAPIAWRTSEELLALAQNSPPAEATLQNTCGGIHARKTFRQVIKIQALKKDKMKVGQETVHMLFEGDYDHETFEGCKVDRFYGVG